VAGSQRSGGQYYIRRYIVEFLSPEAMHGRGGARETMAPIVGTAELDRVWQ
jgi:hypothetical protein